MIKIEASKRLQAAAPDQKMAIKLLTRLGFEDLKKVFLSEDLAQFSYTGLDESKLKPLGKGVKDNLGYIVYEYGNQGRVSIDPKKKIVTLKNNAPELKFSNKKGTEIHFDAYEQEEAFFEIFDKARFGKAIPSELLAEVGAKPAAYTIHLEDDSEIRVVHSNGKSYILEIGVGGEDDWGTESKVAGKQLDKLVERADKAADNA